MTRNSQSYSFNIRVYALILNDDNTKILLCDEMHKDVKMTKFPGGGLEFGEGTIDCLKREAIEEFNQEIEIIDHFYTTDFFQQAKFFENMQLISIYYMAKFKSRIAFEVSDTPFDNVNNNGDISFRWANIKTLKSEDITFPIDKKVAEMLYTQIERSAQLKL